VINRRVELPGAIVELVELRETLSRHLAALDPEARRMIDLSIAGLTPREIAVGLWGHKGSKRAAARVRTALSRIRARLLEAFVVEEALARPGKPKKRERFITPPPQIRQSSEDDR
jgi:hypothetical protein